MGTPRPTPTALRLLKGDTSKGKNPIPKHEPKLKAEIPPRPGNLSGKESRNEWDRITKVLAGVGVITRMDVKVLQIWCDTWASYREASKDITKNGYTLPCKTGWMNNPSIAVMHKARTDMIKLLQELGMTPSARTRVHALPEEDKDELSLFAADA